LSAKGELNTYLPFTELAIHLINKSGSAGLVVKSSIFTADTSAPLLSWLLKNERLRSLYDFRNWKNLFPGVGYHERFALLTIVGRGIRCDRTFYAFYCDSVEDLVAEGRAYSISTEQISRMSPNSGTCPILTTEKDLQLFLHAINRFPVLVNETAKANAWAISYGSLFHMSGASEHFGTKENLLSAGFNFCPHPYFVNGKRDMYVPFYEGKFIQIYDHRFGSFEGVPIDQRFGRKPGTHTPTNEQKNDPAYCIEPRYWIPHPVASARLREKLGDVQYYCAARRVTNVISNARTTMACIMPEYPANDMIVSLAFDVGRDKSDYSLRCSLFVALLNSIAFDYIARLRVAENLLKGVLFELPAPTPDTFHRTAWPGSTDKWFVKELSRRVIELTYNTWDLIVFAQDSGYDGPPFRWDEERRFQIRCELDAAFFRLYLGSDDEWRRQSERLNYFATPRDAVAYIMDTFPIVKSRDEEKFGNYRTKDTILKIYDDLAESQRIGRPYVSPLNPLPGPPTDEHGHFIPMSQWDPNHWPSHIHPPRKERV
jgi:hypothetical protein